MFKKEDLIRTEEYWMENIQNELYYVLKKYMSENNINQSELAKKLGFTKGYVSQVLKGNFNHSTKKLIKILLSIGRVPQFDFIKTDEYLRLMESESKIRVIKFRDENVQSDILKDEIGTDYEPVELEM